jgi:hypothetical protein
MFWLLTIGAAFMRYQTNKGPSVQGLFPTCVIALGYQDGDSRHGEAVVLPTYSWPH